MLPEIPERRSRHLPQALEPRPTGAVTRTWRTSASSEVAQRPTSLAELRQAERKKARHVCTRATRALAPDAGGCRSRRRRLTSDGLPRHQRRSPCQRRHCRMRPCRHRSPGVCPQPGRTIIGHAPDRRGGGRRGRAPGAGLHRPVLRHDLPGRGQGIGRTRSAVRPAAHLGGHRP